MKSIQRITATLMLITLGSSLQFVQAKPIDVPPPACKLADIQITSIQKQDGSDAESVGPINATACYGAFDGNDDVSALGNNLGYDNQGWLNKESSYWPGPGAFITNADLQDLQDKGLIDPGWIFFGKYGDECKEDDEDCVEPFNPASSSKDGTTYTYTNDLVSLSDCKNAAGADTDCYGEDSDAVKGEWTYKPPVTNPEELLNMLGTNKFFDQVTVVFKSGNMFALYNFNIAALGLPPVVGITDENYMFKGVWDMSSTLINKGGNPAGLSHISIWGRDPVASDTPPPVDVSAPMSLALVGLALLLLGVQRRQLR